MSLKSIHVYMCLACVNIHVYTYMHIYIFYHLFLKTEQVKEKFFAIKIFLKQIFIIILSV